MEKRLYLICPDAHLETVIPTHFPGEAYYMTALGACFNLKDEGNIAALHHMLTVEKVDEICVVLSAYCRFMRRVVTRQKGLNLPVEKSFTALYEANAQQLNQLKGAWNRCLLLARLHLTHQHQQLLEHPMLQSRVEQGRLRIRTCLYFPQEDRMQDINTWQAAWKTVYPHSGTPELNTDDAAPVAAASMVSGVQLRMLLDFFKGFGPAIERVSKHAAIFTTSALLMTGIWLSIHHNGLFLYELLQSGGVFLSLFLMSHLRRSDDLKTAKQVTPTTPSPLQRPFASAPQNRH